MPDLDQLDPRLDAAFEHIARDVSGRSTPLGARAAIRTSRRRRGALAGSVAVLALVAGGVAAGQFLPGEDGAGIAERGDGLVSDARPLPDPTPFSMELLDAGTAGWLGPWQAAPEEIWASHENYEGSCFTVTTDDTADSSVTNGPVRVGTHAFAIDPADPRGPVGFATFVEWARAADAQTTLAELRDPFATCESTDSYPLTYDDGTTGLALVTDSEAGIELNVLLQRDGRFGVFNLLATEESGPPSSEVIEQTSDAVAAALQDDETFNEPENVDDSPAEGPDGEPAMTPSVNEFAAIVDGWTTTWKQNGRSPDIDSAPCVGDNEWWYDVDAGMGTGFGTTGEFTQGRWTSATGAQDAWGVLNESLEQCEKARWQVTPGPSSEPRSASLWATYDGGTVFAARHNGAVVVIHLDGEAHPPAELAEEVLTFMADDLMARILPPPATAVDACSPSTENNASDPQDGACTP